MANRSNGLLQLNLQIFDFANETLKNEFVIICNTDIFFDNSLACLKDYSFKDTVLALTRYNVPEYTGKWKRHTRSHDAWIFKTPIKNVEADIILGIPGCDIRIAYSLYNRKFAF